VRTPTALCLACGLAAAFSLSCASTLRRTAGTGDIAFRLVWDGISDLDLFVLDPGGTCIFWGDREATGGGLLDVDCNAASDRMCAAPIENVFWRKTSAPAGPYLFWVRAQTVVPEEAPVVFELQLLRGAEVVWRTAGAFGAEEPLFGPLGIDYPEAIAPQPSALSLPPCTIDLPGSSLHGMMILPQQPFPVFSPDAPLIPDEPAAAPPGAARKPDLLKVPLTPAPPRSRRTRGAPPRR
jgi:hypothetical protein